MVLNDGDRFEGVVGLSEIGERLAGVMDADYIPVWLSTPIEALDNHAPMELITRGESGRVAGVISGLESPGAV